MRKTLAILIGYAALVGCATIINGSNARVQVQSEPPGAIVYVDGNPVGETPLTVQVSHDNHHVRLAKPGYAAAQAQLTASFSGWSLVGFSFIVPVLIDIGTGAITSLDQSAIYLHLQPTAVDAAARKD